MYIQRLTIQNYRNFSDSPFAIQLRPFTLLLGENNIGKANLLNAIALLFSQEIAVFQRRNLQLDDLNYTTVTAFKKKVADPTVGVKTIHFPEVIRAELDESQLDKFHGTVSLPFAAGNNKKVAVKIVDDRGIESLKVIPLD